MRNEHTYWGIVTQDVLLDVIQHFGKPDVYQFENVSLNGHFEYQVVPIDPVPIIELDLEPCPFCGGSAGRSSDGGCKDFVVFCVECNATVKIWGTGTQHEADKQWNTRV